MWREVVASVFAVAAAASVAAAADLPPNTRLGAVFAKPAQAPPRTVAVVREVETYDYPLLGFSPPADIRPLVGGYYGRPNSYYYRSYYGSDGAALWDAYARLPYACGFHGYC